MFCFSFLLLGVTMLTSITLLKTKSMFSLLCTSVVSVTCVLLIDLFKSDNLKVSSSAITPNSPSKNLTIEQKPSVLEATNKEPSEDHVKSVNL